MKKMQKCKVEVYPADDNLPQVNVDAIFTTKGLKYFNCFAFDVYQKLGKIKMLVGQWNEFNKLDQKYVRDLIRAFNAKGLKYPLKRKVVFNINEKA